MSESRVDMSHKDSRKGGKNGVQEMYAFITHRLSKRAKALDNYTTRCWKSVRMNRFSLFYQNKRL